eukprot:CAMPEP_0181104014 /NCGR_PEP_ID=MMETSP1071-20121207/15191_1 /TAXON_ID=35127 /ORGANISM="Thalassiosira sp., Strain NH16" /LENGTH=47 /DNA_ID= /DNA_START= /DNA_END= /DNA_ORIENTATION=
MPSLKIRNNETEGGNGKEGHTMQIMPASSEIGNPVYAFGYPMGVEGP